MYKCAKFHQNRRWCRPSLVELTWNDPAKIRLFTYGTPTPSSVRGGGLIGKGRARGRKEVLPFLFPSPSPTLIFPTLPYPLNFFPSLLSFLPFFLTFFLS